MSRKFLFILALALFILSMGSNSHEGNTERIARSTASKIEKRLEILDEYIADAMSSDTDIHSCLKDLPEDMVIYKYRNDSLVSWSNQFSVLNDDISSKMVFERLTNLKNR